MRTTLAILAIAALAAGCDTSGSGSDRGSIRETNRGGLHDVGGVTPSAPPQAPVDTTAGGISDRDTSTVDSPSVGTGRTGVDSEAGRGDTTGTGGGYSR